MELGLCNIFGCVCDLTIIHSVLLLQQHSQVFPRNCFHCRRLVVRCSMLIAFTGIVFALA